MIKKLLLPLSLAATAWLPQAHGAEPLRIGYVFAMANAPVLIAEKEGYYKDEGLDVDIKALGDGPVIQQALAAHELDVAYVGTPPVYQWYARGLKSVILAKVNYGQAAVLAGSQTSINSLSQLKGHTLAGVKKGSGMDVLLRGLVLRDNARLDPDTDVEIVDLPPGNMNAALDRGLVDAAFSWEPFVSQALLRGSARLLLDVNQAQPQYPWYVVIGLPETLRDRPDDVVKLLRAHRRAIDFLNQHPEQANALIAQAFKLEPLQRADGSTVTGPAIVAEARKRLGWSAELTAQDQQFIERLMNDSVALKFMTAPVPLNELVNTSYLQQAGH